MAYVKTNISVEDAYCLKVQEYFDRTSQIEDAEKFYAAVVRGEAFLHIFLEGKGTNYYKSKAALMKKVEERKNDKDKRPYSSLAIGNALMKLQQREAKIAKVYGDTGIIYVPENEALNKETILDLEVLENDPNSRLTTE